MMKKSTFIDFSECHSSNDLWPEFINNIGLSKAKLAVRQSLDLQIMQGTNLTLPVLILETCGSALVSIDSVKAFIGLNCNDPGIVLIFSTKTKSVQLLREN